MRRGTPQKCWFHGDPIELIIAHFRARDQYTDMWNEAVKLAILDRVKHDLDITLPDDVALMLLEETAA